MAKEKKAAFGGYGISFKGREDTIEKIMGPEKISPAEMTKRLWKYVKKNSLGGKS